MLRLLLFCAFLAAPIARADAPALPASGPGERPVAEPRSVWKSASDFGLALSSRYESNVLHLKDSTRDGFDQRREAGERFADLEEPWDLVTRARISAGREWKRKKGVRFELAGAARYDFHSNNRELGHPEFEIEASVKPRRSGRTTLSFAFTPAHFVKNYEDPAAGSDLYLRGRRMEYEFGLFHGDEFTKKVDWELGLFLDGRDYDAIFDGRDRDIFGALLEFRAKLQKRVRWSNEFEFGVSSSPESFEEGVEVDRSFKVFRFETGLEYRGRAWKLRNGVEMRLRDYSTDNPDDFDRFDRRDTRWSFRSRWIREVGKRQEIWIQLRFVSNSSDRVDGGGDPDIVPYDNLLASLGLERKF